MPFDVETFDAVRRLMRSAVNIPGDFVTTYILVASWPRVTSFRDLKGSAQYVIMSDGDRTLVAILHHQLQVSTHFWIGDGSWSIELPSVQMPGTSILRVDPCSFRADLRYDVFRSGHAAPGGLVAITTNLNCFSKLDLFTCVFIPWGGNVPNASTPASILSSTKAQCHAPPLPHGGVHIAWSFDEGRTLFAPDGTWSPVWRMRCVFYLCPAVLKQRRYDTVSLFIDGRASHSLIQATTTNGTLTLRWDGEMFGPIVDVLVIFDREAVTSFLASVILKEIPNTGKATVPFTVFSAIPLDDNFIAREFMLAISSPLLHPSGTLVSLFGLLAPLVSSSWTLLITSDIFTVVMATWADTAYSHDDGAQRRLFLPPVARTVLAVFSRAFTIPLLLSELNTINKICLLILYKYVHAKYTLPFEFRNLPDVPCTSRLASLWPQSWAVDAHCTSEDHCSSHPGSAICYRQARPNMDGSSHQVCYKKDGTINTDLSGAGTADRIWCDGWWCLEHFVYDFLPFYVMMRLEALGERPWGDRSYLEEYRRYRPNPDPSSCDPRAPQPARAAGDPHLCSLDGLCYTFNGAGEFWFLRAAELSVAVQIRMEIAQASGASPPLTSSTSTMPGTSSAADGATVITAVAVQAKVHTLEVALNKSTSGVHILIDGVVRELSFFDDRVDFGDMSVVSTLGADLHVSVYVHGLFALAISRRGHLLDLVMSASPALLNKTAGLVGVHNGNPDNDFMLDNGSRLSPDASVSSIHDDFGLSWMVHSWNQSLFAHASNASFLMFHRPDFRPYFFDLQTLANAPPTLEELRICGASVECRFDLQATGDPALAAGTAAVVSVYSESVRIAKEAIVEGRLVLEQAKVPPTHSPTSLSTHPQSISTSICCGVVLLAIRRRTP